MQYLHKLELGTFILINNSPYLIFSPHLLVSHPYAKQTQVEDS